MRTVAAAGMGFNFRIFMATMAALTALFAVMASASFAGGAVSINSAQARSLLAKDKRMVLLDVRTPEEYRQAHLRGAMLVPVGELQKRIKEIPRERAVLVYCAVGSRSAYAAGLLASKGYREIYDMTDGLVGWFKNGFPMERGR